MWRAHYVSGTERKCSRSPKSNDGILPGFLIVSTRQENYGLQAEEFCIWNCFAANQNSSLLLKISIPLKTIKDTAARFLI